MLFLILWTHHQLKNSNSISIKYNCSFGYHTQSHSHPKIQSELAIASPSKTKLYKDQINCTIPLKSRARDDNCLLPYSINCAPTIIYFTHFGVKCVTQIYSKHIYQRNPTFHPRLQTNNVRRLRGKRSVGTGFVKLVVEYNGILFHTHGIPKGELYGGLWLPNCSRVVLICKAALTE